MAKIRPQLAVPRTAGPGGAAPYWRENERGAPGEVHDPRLPPDLGDDPTGDQRHHRGRPGHRDRPQEPGGGEEFVAPPPPAPARPTGQEEQSHPDADHGVEGKVGDRYRRPV